MWLRQNYSTIGKIVAIELSILLLIGVVFYFQYSSAKEEFVDKTRAIAETIGEQASTYFSDIGKQPTSDEFYLFLDERLGRKNYLIHLKLHQSFLVLFLRKTF